MRSPGVVIRIIVASLAIAFGSSLTLAATCPGSATVKGAAGALVAAARSGSVQGFSSALNRYADVNAISMFALGKYRSDLPNARRSEYVRSAHRYMSQFLAENAGRFGSSAKLTIDRCSGTLVETTVNGRSRMAWKVARGRVQDLRVEGVWLGQQLRSRFTAIIRRNDGDVGKLVDYLTK